MVSIFNKTFSSVVEALLYFGWTNESGKVLPAPSLSGDDFYGTEGTYEMVPTGGLGGKVLWMKSEKLWDKHISFREVTAGIISLNDEKLVEVCLRQAIDMEGVSHTLLSAWSQNGITNTILRDRMLVEGKVESVYDGALEITALAVDGKILLFVGNPTVTQEARAMARHLLKQ